MAFGIGGNKSSSKSASESTEIGASTQSIAFADLFGQLYGGAAATAGQISGAGVQSKADMLFSSGAGFLDSLMGAGGGGAGSDYLAERVSGDDGVLQSQIGALQESLGSFFREEILPGVRSQSVGARTLGGGRQGIMEARGAQDVMAEFRQGIVGLMGADQAGRDAAAATLQGGQIQGAGTGLAGLQGLLGIGQAGEVAGLTGYAALADILGGPTTLTDSISFGTSKSTSKGKSGGFSFSAG